MDQVKEFLRQCIKYRFWISVGVAALFAIIAYFLGSGPVQAKADDRDQRTSRRPRRTSSSTRSGRPQRPVQADRRGEDRGPDQGRQHGLEELYSRQAPLLTWPETVAGAVPQVGPQVARERRPRARSSWPRSTTSTAYPEYVDRGLQDLQSVRLRDRQGRSSSAPPEEALLRPAAFDTDQARPTSARSGPPRNGSGSSGPLLEVVAQVNKNAKDWDSAIIKQINVLEVGNRIAQDQRSIAKGETLEEAPKRSRPRASRQTRPPTPPAAAAMAGMMGDDGRQDGRMGEMGGMMGGGAAANAESVYFVKPRERQGPVQDPARSSCPC